jgi:phosphatidate cytidylyltransferase
MPIDVPPHSLVAMACVVGLLVAASTTRLVLKARYPERDHTELRQRIQSWWWMIGLLFMVLVVSRGLAIVFFAFLSFLALKEFLSIVPTRHVDRRAIFWAYVSIPLNYFWVYDAWYGMFIIFVPVYVFLFLPLRMVLIGETKGFIRAAALLHWAVMLTVFCLSHLAYLLSLPPLQEKAGAVGPLLFLLIMTQGNDVAQFVWGQWLGRRKIIPKVSPNKTWAGFAGGVATITLVSGWVAPRLTPLQGWEAWGAGAVIALSGFVGDVVISSVKRDLQIKDSSQLIPGHGGLLDRLDSLIYTAPLFFHYLYYLRY